MQLVILRQRESRTIRLMISFKEMQVLDKKIRKQNKEVNYSKDNKKVKHNKEIK